MLKKLMPLPKTFFPFIWHFLRPYGWFVLLFSGLAIADGLYSPFNNMLIRFIINRLPQGHMSALILPGICLVLNFIVLDNVTWRGIGLIKYRYQGVIKNSIINATFDRVLSQSHQFFQDHLSGRLAKQITTLADNIETILFDTSADLIRATSLLLVSLIASFYVNPVFFYIWLVWFVCFAALGILGTRHLVNLVDCHAETETLVSGQIVDVIVNHSNVRMFARKAFESIRLEGFLNSMLQAFQRVEIFFVILMSIEGLIIATMMGFNVYFLIRLYALGRVNIGDFALIMGLSMELAHILWYTNMKFDMFNRAYGKGRQNLSALMMPISIHDKPGAKPLQCHKGQIVFDRVQFRYRKSVPLFQDKSITIKSGQKVGLVGYSGSGKSTFVNLILRFYEVDAGTIFIDDQDVLAVTQDSLYENIATIPQDPSLFHRSLMDNIRYGRLAASDHEVREAARKAHAHMFIEKLEKGYDTLVGERGVKLSGGQRQRIAIARAILKNAPILILDEATSQLDSVTENLIQESLWQLMQGKTTLVIAHRLSTLLHMDRILVFDQGKIVEDGTHQELLFKEGIYKQLWDAQMGGFLGDRRID